MPDITKLVDTIRLLRKINDAAPGWVISIELDRYIPALILRGAEIRGSQRFTISLDGEQLAKLGDKAEQHLMMRLRLHVG